MSESDEDFLDRVQYLQHAHERLREVDRDRIISLARKGAEADALRALNAELVEALKHARSQMQHPDQMIDDAIAKAEREGA